MNYYKEQQKEIETIKERTITLKLSDADCERIARKAGRHGLTVANLLESFIGDLVDGTYSNGSDERHYAERWFERCWFGAFPEETLLKYFFDFGYDMKDIEELCNRIIIIDKGTILYDGTLHDIKYKFGNTKTILLPKNVEINEEVLKEKFKGVVIESTDENIKLKFSLNELELDEMLLHLINEYHVKDFKIEDISIEDITKQLYEANEKGI